MSGIKIRVPGWSGQNDGHWRQVVLDWQAKEEAQAAKHLAAFVAHSAYELSRLDAQERAWEKVTREAADRKRAAEETTIALKEETIKQNALLREQVKALKIANAAAAKQAKSDCLWKWVMFLVALVGVLVAVLF